jgi:hypothetical protein
MKYLVFMLVFDFLFISGNNTLAQDYPNVKYGNLARQYMDIYIAPSTCPTPVYFDAHPNGGNTSMPSSIVNLLKSKGISIVAWESLTTVQNATDIQTGWNDAELMFAWVKANAATYNLDTNNFIIGGSSRGSILSWKYAQKPNPNIKGLYMYNALPSVWNDSTNWWPPNDVTVSAPPIIFVYLREPGCSSDPKNPDIHDPNNGYKIMDKYSSLGIGKRDTLIHSLYKTSGPIDKYQFLLNFILKVTKPCGTNGVNPIVDDNSNLEIFPNPFSNDLTFKISDNELASIAIYDIYSRKIVQETFINSITIDTQQFLNGIYFYQISNSNQIIEYGKVIKN